MSESRNKPFKRLEFNPKKIQILFYSILLGLAIITMVKLRECSLSHTETSIDDYPQILQKGKLIVTTDYNKVGYYLDGDTIHGLQYELIHAFAKEHGLIVEILPVMPLNTALKGLEEGAYNIVIRSIPVTSELRELYCFTEPIVRTKQVLVQRIPEQGNDSALLRNQLLLANKELHVVQGSPSILRIQNLSQEIGDTIYIKEWDELNDEGLIKKVSDGAIQYAVCDAIVTERLTSQYPNIDFQTAISFTQLQSWAVNKNSPVLLDSLNAWIIRYKASGKFENLVKKYSKAI